MESVSSLCSKQEYDFVFQYMTHAYYNPLKTAIQCDIFSGNKLILHSVSVVEEVRMTNLFRHYYKLPEK